MAVMGKPINRIDRRLKVHRCSEIYRRVNQLQMAHTSPIRSTIASSTLTRVDASG